MGFQGRLRGISVDMTQVLGWGSGKYTAYTVYMRTPGYPKPQWSLGSKGELGSQMRPMEHYLRLLHFIEVKFRLV